MRKPVFWPKFANPQEEHDIEWHGPTVANIAFLSTHSGTHIGTHQITRKSDGKQAPSCRWMESSNFEFGVSRNLQYSVAFIEMTLKAFLQHILLVFRLQLCRIPCKSQTKVWKETSRQNLWTCFMKPHRARKQHVTWCVAVFPIVCFCCSTLCVWTP